MKRRLLAALIALTLLLTGCQYAVVEDDTDAVMLPADVAAEEAAESETPLPSPSPTPAPMTDGARGSEVADVQQALLRCGFFHGKADGIFGQQTGNAVKEFQRYLNEISETPDAEYEPDGALMQEQREILLDPEFTACRSDLIRGSTGTEVRRLQIRLQALDYLTSAADGIFGGDTQEALKYFQKRSSIPETGIADVATRAALFSADAVKSDRPKNAYMLKVDVAKQRVYAYGWANGAYSKLVRTMVCSTGTAAHPTPLGTYSAGGRLGRWYYFSKYKCWAQYAFRITGPYYFHSVIYSGKDASTLRQSSLNNLGSRASHGCVRLSVEDARWIYNNCSAGTVVKIA